MALNRWRRLLPKSVSQARRRRKINPNVIFRIGFPFKLNQTYAECRNFKWKSDHITGLYVRMAHQLHKDRKMLFCWTDAIPSRHWPQPTKTRHQTNRNLRYLGRSRIPVAFSLQPYIGRYWRDKACCVSHFRLLSKCFGLAGLFFVAGFRQEAQLSKKNVSGELLKRSSNLDKSRIC